MKSKGKALKIDRYISRRILITILIGCLFFALAFMGIYSIEQYMNEAKYLDAVEGSFDDVCKHTGAFLTDEDNLSLFASVLEGEKPVSELNYRVSEYNVKAPITVRLLLANEADTLICAGFSEDDINLHRQAYNTIVLRNAIDNARRSGASFAARDGLYSTVYYLSGKSAEYVMCIPLELKGGKYGAVSAYLDTSGWQDILGNYQYDTIITNTRNDIIYCSNRSIIGSRTGNKFYTDASYIELAGNRYSVSVRDVPGKDILIYSFIYSPNNYAYIAIGVLTILMLGVLWFLTFREVQTLHEKNLELARINGQMEVRNLQDRMNPHFIYNTLENIKYLIPYEPGDAEKMIEHFTHILRYSISNTKKEVTLSEDIAYLEDYFFIQKMRFGDRFTCEINVEGDLEQYWIPRLLIQPIIENSIKYGFRTKDTLHVRVHFYLEDGYFHATVEDDGGGVEPDELEELRKSIISEENTTDHNGLYNIARRIHLEYGADSGMTVDSTPGQGFTVRLKLAEKA